jgi:4-amino-4-deoxy-L-arabinose transferase-like glycosyltransferase
LRVFALMSQALAKNPKPELIQSTGSNCPESMAGENGAVMGLQNQLLERWGALAVLLLTATLYFVRLGSRALWASEFRWAEITREMLLKGNYFWPTINGRVYYDKPLGSYWLVIASTWITGRMDEATTRIPGAIAGVLAVALLILLARRLYDLRTGVAAGLILATSFGFIFWARTASADVETIAGELAVLLIFMNNENRSGWWVVAMWSIMAVTSLMKGLLGFILPILVISLYSCVADGWAEIERHLGGGSAGSRIHWLIRRNCWFFNWRTPIAITLAAALYFAPFAVSYARSGAATGIYMVYRENFQRYFAPFDHRGPIYLYFYVIFELMAPWSAFLPAALVNAHYRSRPPGEELRSDRFVMVFFWATFIFFSLSGSRRSYYILPILPAAAILVARTFVVAETELCDVARLWLKLGFLALVGVLSLLIIVLLPRVLLPPPFSSFPLIPWPGVFIVCWSGSLALASFVCARYTRQRILLAVGIASYLLFVYLFIFALPAGDRWRGEKGFAQRTGHLLDGHVTELASFKTQAPVFYLGFSKPVPEYDTAEELESAARRGRIKWVILRRRDLRALNLPGREATDEPTYPWDSPEHRGNALVLVRVER